MLKIRETTSGQFLTMSNVTPVSQTAFFENVRRRFRKFSCLAPKALLANTLSNWENSTAHANMCDCNCQISGDQPNASMFGLIG